MKAKKVISLGVLVLVALAGCRQVGEGPTSWFDQPLENSEFPLGTIILQAHASDSDGVKSIEFYLEDYSLIEIDPGGGRMGEAFYNWMPPGPGTYIIYVRSIDGLGNQGMPASTSITITSEIAQKPPEQPVIEPVSEDEEEGEDEIQVEVPEEPSENPQVIPNRAINCRDYPDTSSNILAVLESNQNAVVTGRLSNSTWYYVIHPVSSIQCWVSASLVSTNGDFSQVSVLSPSKPQQPAAEEEEQEPPPELPPQEEDTTPPTIMSASISPTSVYQQGCTGDVQTAVITVEAVDVGGIKNIEVSWSGSPGTVKLNYVSGYTYRATVGPFSSTGSILIYGSAIDNADNWTPFSLSIDVVCCIC